MRRRWSGVVRLAGWRCLAPLEGSFNVQRSRISEWLWAPAELTLVFAWWLRGEPPPPDTGHTAQGSSWQRGTAHMSPHLDGDSDTTHKSLTPTPPSPSVSLSPYCHFFFPSFSFWQHHNNLGIFLIMPHVSFFQLYFLIFSETSLKLPASGLC